jgi:hypothetical protein
MLYPFRAVVSSASLKTNRIANYLALVLLIAIVQPVALASGPAQDKNRPRPCATAEPDLSHGSDVPDLKAYGARLRDLLRQQNFKELDCIAESQRSSKERFSGGVWKLHEFYWALTQVQGHATQEDWKEQLGLAQSWVDAAPQSMTARIVLASSYVDYAWDARGNERSDTVTESGWKLFGERLAKAKAILDDASALPQTDPEWYAEMQALALGQQWSRSEVDSLLKRAVAFEPDYYYYYRSYAYYLMPQWNGDEGEASKFAQQTADARGGDAGDILYFQIGEKIVCACDQPEFGRMSWPRLQKGYALLEKKYGVSISKLNSIALMAIRNNDSVAADAAFKRIGNDWEKPVWNSETYFRQSKEWASQMAPAELKSRAMLEEAAANLQAGGGAEYQKKVEQTVIPLLRQCMQNSSNDRAEFELVVQVGKDGNAQNAWPRRMTANAQCVLGKLYESFIKKETPFPPPPHPEYWLDLSLDPATIGATAAN